MPSDRGWSEIDERLRRVRSAASNAAASDVEDGLRELLAAAVAVSGASDAALRLAEADGTVRSTLRLGTAERDAPDPPAVLAVTVPASSALEATLTLFGDPSRPPSASVTELVGLVAEVVGLLLRNARLGDVIRDRERWLDAVHAITSALLEGEALDEVLRSTTGHARQLVGADLASVAVPGDDDALVLRAADGRRASDIEGVEFPLGNSISGEVIRSGRPINIADVASDPRAAQPVVRLRVFGPALFAPLASHGQPFGTLLVANMRGGAMFDEGDLEVVSTIASHASLAVEYARTQERLHQLKVMDERDRIAEELHESVIQRVFDTGLSIEDVAMRLSQDAPDLAQRLTRAVDELDKVARDIRTAVFSPPAPRA